MYFTLLYFTFFDMMMTSITPNHNVAPIIAAPFYTLWNLFSGFVIPHKVELSHPNAKLRLLEVFYHKIYKIFPSNEKIENINDQYWTLRVEEANNAYIFLGLGLGLVISGAIRVHNDMLLAASLAREVNKENFDKGLIYPPFTNIRKISAEIATDVAAKAYELGLATRLPQPEDLVEYAESCMKTHGM